MKTIITTGAIFADIDAFACAVAYKELIELKGNKDVEVLMSGPLNSTVTNSILNWKIDYLRLDPSGNSNYIIVDCSNITVVPKSANIDNIIEVWDHRFGYQDQWDESKTKVVIDEVGACATLIWEEYKSENLDSRVPTISANLLYTAIFSNTLNFKSSVTTQRDIDAAKELLKYTDLPDDWISIYYKESEEQTLADPENAIKNDTKVVSFEDKDIKITIGQIELWNSFKFIDENKGTIKNVLEGFGNDEWFMTAPSISEGKNYIYTNNSKVKDMLFKTIGARFDEDVAVTSKLWLRKEILKKLLK